MGVGKLDGSVRVPHRVRGHEPAEGAACAQESDSVYRLLDPLMTEQVVQSPCLGDRRLARIPIPLEDARKKDPTTYGWKNRPSSCS